MIPADQYPIVIYVLFWAVRIRGIFRRGQQPLLRGNGWFFNVQVAPGFYEGPGRPILHRYWLRMFIPFLADIPIAVAIFRSGNTILLGWLILGLSAMIHLNHLYSVELAEREARSYAVPESKQPVARVALSLTPRRLGDYTSVPFEIVLAAITLAVAVTARVPAEVLFVYLQAGLLLLKYAIVQRRTPLPEGASEDHMHAQEETRKFYLRVCDGSRAAVAASMIFWVIRLAISPAAVNRATSIWFAVWTAVTIVLSIWMEVRRKQLANLTSRTRPVTLPDFLHQSDLAKWPVCFAPSAPLMMLRGARGYSLNLANRAFHVSAAYVIGLVILLTMLPVK